MLETEIPQKIKISIEFCKSCDTHNWCTHHDQQKYRQAFIDLSNAIRKQVQNVEIVGNELPAQLVPIKAKENKYYDPNCKKYVLYPAIGAFEVYVNQQLIFSKKNTNVWPNNDEIINLIHMKIKGEPRKSIQTHSVISTEKASISEKEQKQTIKMANTILRNIDNTSLYDEKSRKNTTLTDHFKKYSLKNTSSSLESLYAESQSVKGGKISKITPEDIQKLHQIWGKKQNLPNFIKHKAFIQQNEGKKEMLVNLSSIQEESELKQIGPKRNFRKNKLSHLEMEFENLQNKFIRIQNRVSEVKSRKLQFDTIDEGSGKKLKKLNLADKINLVKTVYNPQKLIQQIKDKKKRKIEQYIHSTSEEKNQKLQQIYGAQYLKPNLANSKLKFFRNSKISKNNETKKSNHSNSSNGSQSYSQQDSQSDILINIDKQNHGSSVISLVKKNFSSSQSNFRPNPINKRTIFTREKLSSTPKYFEGQKTMNNFEREKRNFQSRSVLHKTSSISNKLSKNFQINKNKYQTNQKLEFQNKKTNKNARDSRKDEASEKTTNKIEKMEKKSELIKKTKTKGNRNTISKADKQKEIYKMLDGQLKTHKKLRNNKENHEKEDRNYSSSEQKNESAQNSNNLSNSIMKNNSNVKTNKLSKKKHDRQTKLQNSSRISKQSVSKQKEEKQIEGEAISQKQSLLNTKRSEKSRGFRCSRSVTEKSMNKNKSLSASARNQTEIESKKQKLSSSRFEKSEEKEVSKKKQKKQRTSCPKQKRKKNEKRSRTEQNESKQETFNNNSSVKDKVSQQQKYLANQQSDQQISKSQSSLEQSRESNKKQKKQSVSEEDLESVHELDNKEIEEQKKESQQNNVVAQSKPKRIYEIDQQPPEMIDIGIQKYPPKKQSQSQTLQQQFILKQKTQKTLISVHYSDDFSKSNDQAQVRSSKNTSEKQNQEKEMPDKELATTKLFHKQHNDNKRNAENAAIVKQFYGESYKQRLIEHKSGINRVNKSDDNKKKGSFVQISKLYEGEKVKASLFGKDSIEPEKVKDNTGKLKNIIKIISIICAKNQFLIIRLFQNPQVAAAPTYSVCLCENFAWKFFNIPDNICTIEENIVPMSHTGNQRWPVILTQALAQLFGGYDQLSKVSVADLFHSLTGSNYINFKVKEDPEKNSRLLKFITSNEKKNFIILAQKRLHNSLGECIEEKSLNTIFYILSQKSINNNQTLLRMKKMNSDAFWIKLQKFVSQFSQVDVLQLRVNHNFSYLPLTNTTLGHFKIIQFNFSEESFGCVTFVTENKSTDFKIYLYKEQQDNVLRLVGQVSQKNKKYSLFDCCFEQGKYFVFADIKNTQSRVCYMGQSHPQILLKQQIEQTGLKSDHTQYIPINSRPTKKTEQMPKFLNLTKKSQRGEHFGVQSAIRSDNSKKQNINKEKLRAEFIEYLTNN